MAYKSNYPKRTPVFAINSLADPNAAPVIPEEGGIVEEGSNVIESLPSEESGSDEGEGEFIIPEE